MKRTIGALCLMYVLCCQSLYTKVIYVDDIDRARTLNSPFGTIQESVDATQAGNTVSGIDGTYVTVPSSISIQDFATEVITVKSVSGTTPTTLDDEQGHKEITYQSSLFEVKSSHTDLTNLTVHDVPTETQLLQNYPNPFNPETWIPYRLAENRFVTLTIYNSLGVLVRTITAGHKLPLSYECKENALHWDGRNNFGERVASGVYYYHLQAGDYHATKRMILIR